MISPQCITFSFVAAECGEDPDGFSGVEEVPMTSGTWPDGTWNKADEHCRAKAWDMVVGLMSEVMKSLTFGNLS